MPDPPSVPATQSRRLARLATAALGLTLLGIVIAVTRPGWLVGPLQSTVGEAGAAAPIVFVALCALTAPFHFSGVLVVMSPLFWPLPVAAALSLTGTLLGSLLAAAMLARMHLSSAGRDGWPAWLARLAERVTDRPVLIGLAVRFILSTGLAVEAFFAVAGYTRRQYVLVTTLGLAAWVAQALIGVTALTALLARIAVSPGLGAALGAVLLALLGLCLARRRGGRRR